MAREGRIIAGERIENALVNMRNQKSEGLNFIIQPLAF